MCRPFACHGKNGNGVSVMDGCVGGGGFVGWTKGRVGDRNNVGGMYLHLRDVRSTLK